MQENFRNVKIFDMTQKERDSYTKHLISHCSNSYYFHRKNNLIIFDSFIYLDFFQTPPNVVCLGIADDTLSVDDGT